MDYKGAAIVPGDPAKSLLIAAIRHDGDLQMPPKAKLTEAQIAAVTHWVKVGAPWPSDSAAGAKINNAARTHWAFQPVRDPPVPVVPGNESANSVDGFIRAQLAAKQLAASPPADRHTLIRRATFDLTGLPPTPEEVEAFEQDTDPRAYENLIERLLARPQYGEQWGRHWLDVARYSDTKGYVYAPSSGFGSTPGSIATGWCRRSTTTCPTTAFSCCRSPPTRLRLTIRLRSP